MIQLAEPSATAVRAVGELISPVYLVGGSVRDLLLGLTPHDYDFASPLRPDAIEAAVVIAGKKAHTTGKRFGTIGFKLTGHDIEITTFRQESYAPGSRKPQVEFVDDLTHDLSRRDFTINAMALRADGELVDPFRGQADLRHRLIKTVNKPYDRFNEDPLRMLRAARFAAQLDFSVEAETESQANKKSYKILEVSKERWVMELDKLLIAKKPSVGLDFLARTRLLNFILPELAIQVGFNQDSPYHQLDLWPHTLRVVDLTPSDLNLRWAALMHDVGKSFTGTKNKRGYSNYVHHDAMGAELVMKIGPYLRWPKARIEIVRQLVQNHLQPDSPLRPADTAATRH